MNALSKEDLETVPHAIRSKALDLSQRAYESAVYMGYSNPDAYAQRVHDRFIVEWMDGADDYLDRCPDFAL